MMSAESLAAADGNIVRWFERDFGGTEVLTRATTNRRAAALRRQVFVL